MGRSHRSISAVSAVAVTLFAGAIAGCGSSSDDGAAGASTTEVASNLGSSGDPRTSGTDNSGADDEGERVIPVNGDLAEVVWALGAGDQVVATDISATYPEAADSAPKIGYQRALVAEEILTYEPTLVLADDLAGPPEVLDQLRDTGVDVVTIERTHTLDEPPAKIRAVAEALGVDDGLADDVQAEIDTALDSADAIDAPKVMAIYLRGENVQLVFGEGSGIDAVIAGAGGIDMGTELGIDDNEPISAEAIVEAGPEVLIVGESGLESVGGIEGLTELDGIAQTPAAQNGHIYAFEDQYLFGLGPRTGDLLTELIDVFGDVK